MAEAIDIDHLRRWIGREETASDLASADLARRYAATLDLPGPALREGDPAPRMLHLCLAPPVVPMADLGPDGHPARGGFLPPVPLPRRMWAGGEMVFHDEIRLGEAVTRISRIRDVTAKQGRSGPLVFVTVDHAFTASGRALLSERQDIVYRGAEARTPAPPPAEAASPAGAGASSRTGPGAPEGAGARARRIVPSAPLLFRYSALTFNGHRIHYDAPYARAVEGYPGLVVHGPLQATQLALHAEAIAGRPPARFGFRSLSPLFDTADYLLDAEEDGPALRLWTARPGGPVAMEARAEW